MTDDLSEVALLLRQILAKLDGISQQLERLDDIRDSIQDFAEEMGDLELVVDDSEAPG
jgi:hypothetical protein